MWPAQARGKTNYAPSYAPAAYRCSDYKRSGCARLVNTKVSILRAIHALNICITCSSVWSRNLEPLTCACAICLLCWLVYLIVSWCLSKKGYHQKCSENSFAPLPRGNIHSGKVGYTSHRAIPKSADMRTLVTSLVTSSHALKWICGYHQLVSWHGTAYKYIDVVK